MDESVFYETFIYFFDWQKLLKVFRTKHSTFIFRPTSSVPNKVDNKQFPAHFGLSLSNSKKTLSCFFLFVQLLDKNISKNKLSTNEAISSYVELQMYFFNLPCVFPIVWSALNKSSQWKELFFHIKSWKWIITRNRKKFDSESWFTSFRRKRDAKWLEVNLFLRN